MNDLNELTSLGLTLPSPAYVLGAVLFSVLGLIAYRHGKRADLPTVKWLGVALMLYSYATPSTALLYLVGTALSVAAYLFRFR